MKASYLFFPSLGSAAVTSPLHAQDDIKPADAELQDTPISPFARREDVNDGFNAITACNNYCDQHIGAVTFEKPDDRDLAMTACRNGCYHISGHAMNPPSQNATTLLQDMINDFDGSSSYKDGNRSIQNSIVGAISCLAKCDEDKQCRFGCFAVVTGRVDLSGSGNEPGSSISGPGYPSAQQQAVIAPRTTQLDVCFTKCDPKAIKNKQKLQCADDCMENIGADPRSQSGKDAQDCLVDAAQSFKGTDFKARAEDCWNRFMADWRGSPSTSTSPVGAPFPAFVPVRATLGTVSGSGSTPFYFTQGTESGPAPSSKTTIIADAPSKHEDVVPGGSYLAGWLGAPVAVGKATTIYQKVPVATGVTPTGPALSFPLYPGLGQEAREDYCEKRKNAAARNTPVLLGTTTGNAALAMFTLLAAVIFL